MRGRMGAVHSEPQFTIAGEVVTIRPMRITDIAIETEFIRRLSARSKHFRFMGGVKELSAAEVAHLCNVDGKLSMAFVATTHTGGQETEIGVSRCAPGPVPEDREFAVTVADEWQRRGLGTLLMKHLIESARRGGVKRLYSVAFWDNAGMRALARRLGMVASQDPADPQQTVYWLAL